MRLVAQRLTATMKIRAPPICARQMASVWQTQLQTVQSVLQAHVRMVCAEVVRLMRSAKEELQSAILFPVTA